MADTTHHSSNSIMCRNEEDDTRVRHININIPEVKHFYFLETGVYVGMWSDLTCEPDPSKIEVPKGYDLEIRRLSQHPATGIELMQRPLWILLMPNGEENEYGVKTSAPFKRRGRPFSDTCN